MACLEIIHTGLLGALTHISRYSKGCMVLAQVLPIKTETKETKPGTKPNLASLCPKRDGLCTQTEGMEIRS